VAITLHEKMLQSPVAEWFFAVACLFGMHFAYTLIGYPLNLLERNFTMGELIIL